MENLTLESFANVSAYAVIAYVFFKGYFEDKKKSYEFNEKVLIFQKEMAVILNQAKTTIEDNNDLNKDARVIHSSMDNKIERIFDEMATAQSQNELIKAVNDLREAWEGLRK